MQIQLLLHCSLTKAQRRFTMKRLMSWSRHSGFLMLLLAPQFLLLVLRNKPKKLNLSQALQNQNPCRTVQNPAQLQRSVWESPLGPVLSSQGMHCREPCISWCCIRSLWLTEENRSKMRKPVGRIEKVLDAHVCSAHLYILLQFRKESTD